MVMRADQPASGRSPSYERKIAMQFAQQALRSYRSMFLVRGVLRAGLGHLWHIDRPLAWCRAAHRDLVDRHLRDCVWSHVPCGVLPVAFSDCSLDLMVNTSNTLINS